MEFYGTDFKKMMLNMFKETDISNKELDVT